MPAGPFQDQALEMADANMDEAAKYWATSRLDMALGYTMIPVMIELLDLDSMDSL